MLHPLVRSVALAVRTLVPAALAALLLSGLARAQETTLEGVMARGALRCGVNPDLEGFSIRNGGSWSGFDVDYCRAIAAAVLGDGNKVVFVPLTTKERFSALQDGDIDVLIRDTGWTMARDTTFGLTFAAINFYNGYGFLVPLGLGVTSALQLSGALICVEPGSIAEKAVAQFFTKQDMTYRAVFEASPDGQRSRYEAGDCNVIVGDIATLPAMRQQLRQPDQSVVLDDTVGKDPFGPVVRDGDPRWAAIVRWVHFALLNAEEFGVTADTVDSQANSPVEDIRNLLGLEGTFGQGLGLRGDWAAEAIRAVGNYGEIFERNLGSGSRLKMRRGLNALWTDGGLQFAPPIR